MATFIRDGQRTWGGQIDADGHRTWEITFLTEGDAGDGPAQHVQTPGLPQPGDIWAYDNDIDIWAWFRVGPTNIRQLPPAGLGSQDHTFFEITHTASTRPPDNSGPGGGGGGKDDKGARKKCADAKIEDPLSEPPATSGSSIRYQEELSRDWRGKPLRYTSFEPIRGAQATFDRHRDQVIVEQNMLNLDYELVRSCMDKLNDAPLWNLPARCWKLSDWSWQRKLYGTCNFYYTRRLTFESNVEEVNALSPIRDDALIAAHIVSFGGRYWLPLWDHLVTEESNRVLNGHWNKVDKTWVLDNIAGAVPDPTKVNHYINAFDPQLQPCRVMLSRTNLGQPVAFGNEDDRNILFLEGYATTNMFQLNLPTNLY